MFENDNFGQMSKNEFWEKRNKKQKLQIKIWETTTVAFLMKFGTKNGFEATIWNKYFQKWIATRGSSN